MREIDFRGRGRDCACATYVTQCLVEFSGAIVKCQRLHMIIINCHHAIKDWHIYIT